MAGLTDAGLTIKDLEEILAEFVADQLANIDADLITEADSLLGQLNGIYAAAVFDLWEALEEVHGASFPSSASGQALADLALITGTVKRVATPGEWNIRFYSDAAGVVPEDTTFYVVGDPDSRWTLPADATMALTTDTVSDIVFSAAGKFEGTLGVVDVDVGQVFELANHATNNGLFRLIAKDTGTSWSVESIGFTYTFPEASESADVKRFDVDVLVEGETPGPDAKGFDGDLLVIVDPIPGTIGDNGGAVTSGNDYLPGLAEETDSELRVRRIDELASPGSGTAEAIRADLLAVTGVDVAFVFENPTGTTDANGLPPYSIECLVYSDTAPSYTAQDVVDAIWNTKPAGTETFGGLSGTAVDTSNESHTIYYSEPSPIQTYIDLEFTMDPDLYAGDQAVETAILEWHALNITMGDDVLRSDIIAVVQELGGVVNVDPIAAGVDDAPAPGSVDLTITGRQVSTLARADINLTSTSIFA